jgi:hypothetical protein
VEIDVVDIGRRKPGAVQGALHGRLCPEALRMGCRHVKGIAALSDAEQPHGAGRDSDPLQQRESRALADGQAIALRIEGAARSVGGELQGVKTIEGGQAQGIHAADDRGVAGPRGDHACRAAEYLRGRGAS